MGQSALFLAVRHGRVVMVRLLLSCGADANVQDRQGATALMCASERGHTHIARLLLDRAHCDVSLTDRVGTQTTHVHTGVSTHGPPQLKLKAVPVKVQVPRRKSNPHTPPSGKGWKYTLRG